MVNMQHKDNVWICKSWNLSHEQVTDTELIEMQVNFSVTRKTFPVLPVSTKNFLLSFHMFFRWRIKHHTYMQLAQSLSVIYLGIYQYKIILIIISEHR